MDNTAGDMTTRQAKQMVGDVTKNVVDAIKILGAYEHATWDLGKDETVDIPITQHGETTVQTIGKADVKKFKKNLIDVVLENEKRAMTVNKTRTNTKPRSALSNIGRLNDHMMAFFKHAEFGPLVVRQGGDGTRYQNMKQVPARIKLSETDEKLVDSLYFVQGTATKNPIYGIAPSSLLIPLFSLHAFYEGMSYADNAKYMSASDAMRKHLSKEMEAAIKHDVQEYVDTSSEEDGAKAKKLEKTLIKAIHDPSLLTEEGDATLAYKQSKSGVKQLFNPNRFIYGHFGKLISAGKVANTNPRQGPVALKKDDLEKIRPKVKKTYGKLFAKEFEDFAKAYENMVARGERNPLKKSELAPIEEPLYECQQYNVVLAGAYKKRR